MVNSVDPDQLEPTDLDLHCLQRQGISGFSRTRVKNANILLTQHFIYRRILYTVILFFQKYRST